MAKAKESNFGFSWADEVEREEAQEKENQIQREREIRGRNSERSNPFGAARPREVNLEQNGVDWRKLDQDFSFDSSIRECKTKSTIKKKPLDIQKCRNTSPSEKTVPCDDLVPPLKYPPKNIESVFEEIHRARKLKSSTTNPNVKPNDQWGEISVSISSNPKRASQHPNNAKRASKISTNQTTHSNLNRVLVNSNNNKFASVYVAKENTGSNFEPKSVEENGTKEEEQVQRRVLVDKSNTNCKKNTCSKNYFGVLELLEPSSRQKSNCRKRTAASTCEELKINFGAKFEGGNENRDQTIGKRKKGNRSKK